MTDAADKCFGAAVGLMAAVRSNALRERALADRDDKVADLVRSAVDILDAVTVNRH